MERFQTSSNYQPKEPLSDVERLNFFIQERDLLMGEMVVMQAYIDYAESQIDYLERTTGGNSITK